MAVKGRTVDDTGNFEHPLYETMLSVPGLSVATASIDSLLTWGLTNSLWVFPMATSCCGIELMAAAASRVDLDRMGSFLRGTPRHSDVMVVAGTITVKMAPRVLKLWQQMPEPKWCIAMGSCAISGDFYRNLYSVVPGIDTFLPVDVYVPGCPPNPEALMHGMLRLQEKVRRTRAGEKVTAEVSPTLLKATNPSIARLCDGARPAELSQQQEQSADTVTLDERREALSVPQSLDTTTLPSPEDFEALVTSMGVAMPKDGPPLVPGSAHVELARRLKAIGYRQFVSCVATHWLAGTGRQGKAPAEPEHFEVAYSVRTVGPQSRLAAWAVRVGPGEPVPTLSGVFAGADWQEREQYDLVGVPFAGHPDLRRLMMPENYTGHPLRRDFPSNAPLAPWR
jgi:NADH-quinone oxidoreductase subunit B/C/D